MKKYFFAIILWIICYPSLYALEGRMSMPMPKQYDNLEQYYRALETWESVYKNAVACSTHIQLPSIPMPRQYNDLKQYETALAVWERVGRATQNKEAIPQEGNVIHLSPLPLPQQYETEAQYQQALQAIKKVYKQVIMRSQNVQPPPLPAPTQYIRGDHYEEALQIWQAIFDVK